MAHPQSPFPPGFTISTPRLRITPFDPTNQTHCAFLVQVWNTDDFISSCGNTSIDTPEKASDFIRKRILTDYARNRHGIFLVSLYDGQQGPNTPIGTVSLMQGTPPGPHYLAPDVGYAILPEHSGKGLATEAAQGVLEYARTELGKHDAFGFCAAGNPRSRRVLEKIGMEFRGVSALKAFGGAESAVYAWPSMSADLTMYGLTEEIRSE